jgi:hypothetical protein
MQGDQQAMQEFESGGRFAELEERLWKAALLRALLVLSAAIAKRAIGDAEPLCDSVLGLPPKSDLASLFEDAGMLPAGRAGFPLGVSRRTLLIGIHGLGSFHVWQNKGIPNLDALFNKLAAKPAQTNDQGPPDHKTNHDI